MGSEVVKNPFPMLDKIMSGRYSVQIFVTKKINALKQVFCLMTITDLTLYGNKFCSMTSIIFAFGPVRLYFTTIQNGGVLVRA